LGLHRYTVEELKVLKGVPEKEDYLDNITRAELSAIDFKNTQTEDKLLRDNLVDQEVAAQTHYFVGDQVRKAIQAIHAPLPEDLPEPTIVSNDITRFRSGGREEFPIWHCRESLTSKRGTIYL